MVTLISRFRSLSVALVALGLFSNAALADLLGVVPGYPLFTYNNQGVIAFDSGSMALNVDATPLDLTLNLGDTPAFVADPRSVTIRIEVNGACNVSGGNLVGNDLEVVGDVYDGDTFALLYSGILLTGTISDMGETAATETTSIFDFRFSNAGGLLVSEGAWPAGQEIGLLLTSENSDFADDCTVSFSGGAKGSIGPIDPLQPPIMEPTATQGYWKNHLSAWPIDPITVGGVTRSAAEANNLLRRPPKGDKTWSMYRQLTAAVLNLANGSDPSCIQAEVDAANQWLIDNPLGSGVKAGSSAWKDSGDALHETLDAYNNGELCAPHRDD